MEKKIDAEELGKKPKNQIFECVDRESNPGLADGNG